MSSRWRIAPRKVAAAFALLLAVSGAAVSGQESDAVELRAAAEAGDADAQNDLGGRLLAAEDPALAAEAREWFRRSAEAGDAEGMNNYATMLLLGLGGEPDEAEGRRLRGLAASRGSVGAHLSIAEHYLRGGEGYPHDPARGLEHVRAAAESSSPNADYAKWRLAMMYLQGVGTAPNAAEAYRWVVLASEAGSVNAMISRAVMLATGEGVAEDDVAARDWYQRASVSGDVNFAHAMRGLGAMLISGEGGQVDLPRGIAYLRIALAADDENAGRLLEHWRDLITPQVDRQAWEIANAWMAEHMPAD